MPLFLLFLFIGTVLFLKSCNNFAKCKVSQLDDISGWYIYAGTTSEHFINTFKKSLKPVDYWSHTSVSLIVGRAPDL